MHLKLHSYIFAAHPESWALNWLLCHPCHQKVQRLGSYAVFDAYMTGACFACLMRLLEASSAGPKESVGEGPTSMQSTILQRDSGECSLSLCAAIMMRPGCLATSGLSCSPMCDSCDAEAQCVFAALPPPQPMDPESIALTVQRRADADAGLVEYSSQQPDLSSVQVRPMTHVDPTRSLLTLTDVTGALEKCSSSA